MSDLVPTPTEALAATTRATTTNLRVKKTGPSHLAAGAVSGLATCIALQPLDVIKTRMQQTAVELDRSASKGGALPLARLAQFRALGVSGQIHSVLTQVVHERGIPGLWRGTAPTVLRNVPGSAFYFYFLHHLRSAFSRTQVVSRDSANMISGAAARGTAGLIFMPISVIKVRYESSQYAYTSVIGAARGIVQLEGVRGLFAGVGATTMRDVPYAGIYVALYEQLKAAARTAAITAGGDPAAPASAATTMACGVAAGTLATCVTQPFDLLRTRVQLSPQQYPNSLVAARKVLAAEGVRGFFSGMVPRLVRKPLHAAITWTVYEAVVRAIEDAEPR
ncbi:mitochondrial carrier domain-containing protein [Blastocladiella britannica]|nr:mitochondrial carrier domain-containing protein [Blastocladiella britannica]